MKEKSFYGREQATVPAITDEYPGIDNPVTLYERLKHIWCEYTCAPRLREEWSEENITLGQCSITAFLVKERYEYLCKDFKNRLILTIASVILKMIQRCLINCLGEYFSA